MSHTKQSRLFSAETKKSRQLGALLFLPHFLPSHHFDQTHKHSGHLWLLLPPSSGRQWLLKRLQLSVVSCCKKCFVCVFVRFLSSFFCSSLKPILKVCHSECAVRDRPTAREIFDDEKKKNSLVFPFEQTWLSWRPNCNKSRQIWGLQKGEH